MKLYLAKFDNFTTFEDALTNDPKYYLPRLASCTVLEGCIFTFKLTVLVGLFVIILERNKKKWTLAICDWSALVCSQK